MIKKSLILILLEHLIWLLAKPIAPSSDAIIVDWKVIQYITVLTARRRKVTDQRNLIKRITRR